MRCCCRGYVQVWNGDAGPPNTSLNQIVPGAVVNDSIYVKVAANGRLYILSTVATDVVIEIHEWEAANHPHGATRAPSSTSRGGGRGAPSDGYRCGRLLRLLRIDPASRRSRLRGVPAHPRPATAPHPRPAGHHRQPRVHVHLRPCLRHRICLFQRALKSRAAPGVRPSRPERRVSHHHPHPTDAPLGRAWLVPDGPTRYVCTGGAASCGRYYVLVTISH